MAVEKVLNIYWGLRVCEDQGVGNKCHNESIYVAGIRKR